MFSVLLKYYKDNAFFQKWVTCTFQTKIYMTFQNPSQDVTPLPDGNCSLNEKDESKRMRKKDHMLWQMTCVRLWPVSLCSLQTSGCKSSKQIERFVFAYLVNDWLGSSCSSQKIKETNIMSAVKSSVLHKYVASAARQNTFNMYLILYMTQSLKMS